MGRRTNRRQRAPQNPGHYIGGSLWRLGQILAPVVKCVPPRAWVTAGAVLLPLLGFGIGAQIPKGDKPPPSMEAVLSALDTLSSRVGTMAEQSARERMVFAGKIDTVNIQLDRLRRGIGHLRGGTRALEKVLQEDALEHAWKGPASGAHSPFDPTKGFTASVLSGKEGIYNSP